MLRRKVSYGSDAHWLPLSTGNYGRKVSCCGNTHWLPLPQQETAGERFPAAVMRTGFPYRQENAGERFPAAVMHYGLPYRQETLLQNVLTLVHYHLVLCEGNKKSLSAGKPTGFWREGKLLSRKSKVKMIRINAPPFLRLAAVFPFIMGI